MIDARFTKEMRDVLKKLQGAEFVGYSTAKGCPNVFYSGIVNLQTSNGQIKISNKAKQIPWFKGKELSDREEIFAFHCEETPMHCREKDENFISVREKIEGIEIITDKVEIPEKAYKITLDMAVIFYVGSHRYMISRGFYFTEYLELSLDQNYDAIYSLKQALEDWNNSGEWMVTIERVVEKL